MFETFRHAFNDLHRLLRVRSTARPGRSFLAPFVIGIGILAGFPQAVAYQDMASLVSGAESGSRWGAFIERSAAGSIQDADMPFLNDRVDTAAISGAGMETPGIGTVAFRSRGGFRGTTPDEKRINRADKKGRVVRVAPMAPPKEFNAGSIFERTGLLLDRPGEKQRNMMAFEKPAIKGKEVKLASTFFIERKQEPNPFLPPVVAALVNNDHADILATAYAPAEPDYAKASPFASILTEDDGTDGRFIPPVAKDDHAWGRSPLPPGVFSGREQNCLAAGVYFEARGEAVKGQAAVAQVILNRVRNPSYPNSICGVVYQNKSWRNRCQFSFACDGLKERVSSPSHFRTARDVAMAVTAGKIWLPAVGTATHYHATYVHPRWARTMEKVKRIGRHVFYRTYGGGWE